MARAFIDANVFIYATASAPSIPNCQAILELASANPQNCVTSAEVLQEILYVLSRQNQERRVLESLRSAAVATSTIYPLDAEDVMAAARLPLPGFSARDRCHCAIMQRYQVGYVISADNDFDRVPGITRLAPADLPTWRDLVFGST